MHIIHKGSFDYISCELTCVECGHAMKDPVEAELQTKISNNPQNRIIKVGDYLRGKSNPETASYFILNNNYQPDNFTFIEDWFCDGCGPFKWVRFEVCDTTLKKSEVVQLNTDICHKTDLLPLSVANMIPSKLTNEMPVNIRQLLNKDKFKFVELIVNHSKLIIESQRQ